MKKTYIQPHLSIDYIDEDFTILTLTKDGSSDYSGGSSGNSQTGGGDSGNTDGNGFVGSKNSFTFIYDKDY